MKKSRSRNRGCLLITLLLLISAIIIVPYIYNTVMKMIYPLNYSETVAKYSAKYDVDAYLIMGIIKAESNFNQNAVSSKEAKGLMQITDSTGVWAAAKAGITDFTTDSLYDPTINIQIGCWYIKYLEDEFNGNIDYAILAYNGGSGNVKKWLSNSDYTNSKGELTKIPFKETEDFLKRVTGNRDAYKKIYKEGIS